MDEGGWGWGGLTALVLMCLCLFSRPAHHFLFDHPEREGGDKRTVISVKQTGLDPISRAARWSREEEARMSEG